MHEYIHSNVNRNLATEILTKCISTNLTISTENLMLQLLAIFPRQNNNFYCSGQNSAITVDWHTANLHDMRQSA